uniref:Uncharacterized protein n=1 Tax=Rhizophora mucronata TaxID=61149 RepID=A0A2P2PJJ2_RHIMU
MYGWLAVIHFLTFLYIFAFE